ncbi:hypothetical protein FE257_006007 [Aspergillus nanangensis]|uniref:Reverse transcriptase domain-containing protein n=1 Tax=Aspergillus nanangensis TaxID=2582783 RepID=A0AAD4CPK7_ASPNN|nr:hypothetical protein FE257_006007 [Aspergillus nanangensis]
MAAVSALSQTLQSLTSSKIRELEKQKTAYENRKANIYADADQQPTLFNRVETLLTGTNKIYPDASNDNKIENIERALRQHRYDSAVTEAMLAEFEQELRDRLDKYSRKLRTADLYSRLLTQWTTAPEDGVQESSSEADYMMVDDGQKQRLKQLCDQFEEVVFTPQETNKDAIKQFLDGLFPDEDGKGNLKWLREQVKTTSTALLEETPFDIETTTVTIRGLLTEDILSEEKQGVLKSLLQNKVALREINDVLNLRWNDLDNWDWYADDGIPVLPRQQLNGKYRIWMDEDVLQLIFVQYIGMRLCILLKRVLQQFIMRKSAWNWAVGPQLTDQDQERRSYYTGTRVVPKGVEQKRKDDYHDTYFLSQLPTAMETLVEQGGSYDNDEDDDEDEDEDDDDDDDENICSHTKNKNVKQELLRTIATETLIHRNIYGKAAVIQSDLQWFATGLSHSTIFALMEYLGFDERWIEFFHTYLESPLNMDKSSEGREPVGPRIRKRGVPMAHASEKMTGELVLFFMDLAVNRETGLLLYRLHDDLWVCGDPSQCARAWEVMGKYAKATGLEFNTRKTGSVYLAESIDDTLASRLPSGPVIFGFLKLDPQSGTWVIDHEQVYAHLRQLKKQLEECNSVISWIRTWNSCIGRFFKNTFGQPAHCFGQPHVDSILATYKMMQEVLFGESTVTQHLRGMIQSQFGEFDFPDAFFYFPEKLGGLGLRNPFISAFLVRDNMESSPLKLIENFQESERTIYQNGKNQFEKLSEKARRQRLPNKDTLPVALGELNTYMSFEEYSRFRWQTSPPFLQLYKALHIVPEAEEVQSTYDTSYAIAKVMTLSEVKGLDQEKRWILQMYRSEMEAKYGSMSLVDKRYLPVGVMQMVKDKKVKWQMVL